MSLVDRIAEHTPNRKGACCTVCLLLTGLSDEDRTVLEAAFGDKAFTSMGLTRILVDEGFRVGAGAVGRHRRGDCVGGAE